MKVYKINGESYEVPTSWMDISYKKFLDMKDMEAKADKMDEQEYNIQYISLMASMPDDVLLSLDQETMKNILINIYSFSQTEIPIIDNIIVTINEQTYVQDKNTSDMCWGQWIDLEEMNKNAEIWDIANKICASFLRKSDNTKLQDLKIRLKKVAGKTISPSDYTIKKYDYNELLKDADVFMNSLPIPYIYSNMVFFLTFVSRLQNSIADYSQLHLSMKKRK